MARPTRPTLPFLLAMLVLALAAGLETGVLIAGRLTPLAQAAEAPPPGGPSQAPPWFETAPAPPWTQPAPAPTSKQAQPATPTSKAQIPGTQPSARVPAQAPAAGPAPRAVAQDRVYTVQIASFKDVRRALRLAADLRGQGLQAQVLASRGRGGAAWHAVRAGEFSLPSQAAGLAATARGLTGQPVLVRGYGRAFLARNTVDPARIPDQEPARAAVRPAPPEPPAPAAARVPARPGAKISAPSGPAARPGPEKAAARPEGPGAVEEKLRRGGVEVVLRLDPSRTPAAPAPAAPEPSPGDWVHAVQAAGFSEPGEALDLVRTLSGQGVEASVLYLHGWYVVHAGAFEDRDAARARADAVRGLTGREPTVRATSRRTLNRHAWRPEPERVQAPEPAVAGPFTPSPGTTPPDAPGQDILSQAPGAARTGNPLDLLVRVEDWGRPDLSGATLVATCQDPREAGGMARRLRDEGVAALVVHAGGPEPWSVYRR